MYPALGALALAAGMAASALNVNGLGIMNKSAFAYFCPVVLSPLSHHVFIYSLGKFEHFTGNPAAFPAL